jgi:rubrerythrin
MHASTRLLSLLAVGGALALAACGGGSDVSPTGSTAAVTVDGGVVTSSGNGPGAPPAGTPSTGTGTCTNDCDGTGQGPGPGDGGGSGSNGSGYGYGAGYGYGPDNGGGNGGPGPGPGEGLCGDACTGPVGPDPADIVTILERAVQEEHKAEALYRSVLATFGEGTLPFAVIADSEAQHVAAIERLFARRQLTPPPSTWSVAAFPPFASVALACAAGVGAEEDDAAFYTPYLERTDIPQDVRIVFTNLQRASLENHLPAFERCR